MVTLLLTINFATTFRKSVDIFLNTRRVLIRCQRKNNNAMHQYLKYTVMLTNSFVIISSNGFIVHKKKYFVLALTWTSNWKKKILWKNLKKILISFKGTSGELVKALTSYHWTSTALTCIFDILMGSNTIIDYLFDQNI